MAIVEFPPVELADQHGLLAMGGDLEVPSLLLAYRSGIFPWPIDEDHLTWFAPPQRAVLFVDEAHFSKRFLQKMKSRPFDITVNSAFTEVIKRCAHSPNRRGQGGTWITADMIEAYLRLHEAGFAHSIEAYQNGTLVGGLYGVMINGFFAAESMYYEASDASKACLYYLVQKLRSHSVDWFDCQVQNPFLEKLGVSEIPRLEFMQLLHQALQRAPYEL